MLLKAEELGIQSAEEALRNLDFWAKDNLKNGSEKPFKR